MSQLQMVDLTFGRLKVIEEIEPDEKQNRRFKVVCQCGNVRVMYAASIRRSAKRALTTVKLTGCGSCQPRIKYPKEYRAWQDMKNRCYNSNYPKFHRWGGRGIKVCAEWLNDFFAFLDHIGSAPGQEYSVNRINNNGHYTIGNVEWATAKEQANNRG